MEPTHYDLIIIGSGSGNSLIDPRLDGLTIAMVDDAPWYGGTCLNVGCIPTKMFVLPADHVVDADEAARLGVTQQTTAVDWPAIRDRIFGRIDPISAGGLDWRERQAHVGVYRETATFVDPYTLALAPSGRRITADRIVLAAGSRPRQVVEPDADVEHLVHTSDSIMRVDELPARLVVLGGGFVAAEFGHVFSAYGSQVTMIIRGDRLLRREDEDVSAAFTELVSQRMQVATQERVQSISAGPDGGVRVTTVAADGTERHHDADLVLNATGRIPNGDRLNLPAAGVEVDDAGFVKVDQYQRTSVEHIWALGDVCQPCMLKHVANREMRTVMHNLLHPDDLVATDHRHIPHAVFAHPQIGAVGATEAELKAQGRPYVVKTQRYGDVAYGWALEDQSHFAKLLADPQTGKLLGAHLMGPQAATLVQQLIHMMQFEQDIESVATQQYWIHPALPELVENALLGLVEQRREWLAGRLRAAGDTGQVS
ncbi:mycothione reductase [Aestuariimicrobium sp. Y1814]|uniref:mycothione reductase n=1 Tax=Aestuariimicrobium sp. Y1814 TaxID=3418742 RepID=UPI003DA78919